MTRLVRPSMPIEVKCRVALRQLGEAFPDDVIRDNRFVPRVVPSRSLGKLLGRLLDRLAALLNCPREQLHLDHDPALENRTKTFDDRGRHVDYVPPANDPEHLYYRPYGPEFAGSHKIKTIVRGDHGQYSDAALARKNKRIAKKRAAETHGGAHKSGSKKAKQKQRPGRASVFKPKIMNGKRKIASRPFPKGRTFKRRST